jgi:3-methyladenine DNA glycosylase Mpg
MSRALWESLLTEPAPLADDASHEAWFDSIARRLLCGSRLMVTDVPHRFTEIEFYYHGGTHLDTFTHRDPIQKSTARWYFHRTNGVYRGGSFKGFDLTFGGSSAFGGVLIRGIEQENGPLVDGPSLSVDHLLRSTELPDVASLDEAIEGRPAWDQDNPLSLVWLNELADRPILKTARVGLSLKRLRKADAPTRYILKPYRYLSESKRIAKGKLHMALALHARGSSPTEVRDQTGCTKAALERYMGDFAEGQQETSFDGYFGIELGPKELARMHGLWWSTFGKGD